MRKIVNKVWTVLLISLTLSNAHDYKAQLLEVKDGDTVELYVSLGFDILKRVSIRLEHIDVYETTRRAGQTEAEKQKGIQAKKWVSRELGGAKRITISHTCADDIGKYGRTICDIQYTDGSGKEKSLVQELRKMGFVRKEVNY